MSVFLDGVHYLSVNPKRNRADRRSVHKMRGSALGAFGSKQRERMGAARLRDALMFALLTEGMPTFEKVVR